MYEEEDKGWAGGGYTVLDEPEPATLTERPVAAMQRLTDIAVRRSIVAKTHDDLGADVWFLAVDAVRDATRYGAARGCEREPARRLAGATLNRLAAGLPFSYERVDLCWHPDAADDETLCEYLLHCLTNTLADEVLSTEWTCAYRFAAAVDDLRALVEMRAP